MQALVADGRGSASLTEVENYPVRDTFVKIKVYAIALNPTDYKHVYSYTKGGEIVGCDVAGTVEAIGVNAHTKVKIGDRIAGLVHGCNSYSPRDGGFAEHAEIKDGIFAHLPDDWTWEQGATLGAGITTAAQGLFQALQLPIPGSVGATPVTILIYGGGTATGCLAIQLARKSGMQVITTASPNQFDRLKKLGADMCYDYHDPEVGRRIRQDTKDELMFAFDIISNEGSMKICSDALASEERDGNQPRCTLLLPGKKFPRSDVKVGLTSGYSVIGETSIKYGNLVAGDQADYEFGKTFWALVNDMMRDGQLVPHDVELRSGGLSGVMSGLKDLCNGKVSGKKLVYLI